MATQINQTPSASELRDAFDAPAPLTVGLEEELLVVDAETFDLAPVPDDLIGGRFKRELPAAQLEIVTSPHPTVAGAIAELRAGRTDAAAALADSGLRAAGAALHPVAAALGELTAGERYERIEREYGTIARRQLVFALQVHVAVGDADRALAVLNALRVRLPLLAALAANSPFYEGMDTRLASMRLALARLLPRQGIPPHLSSWDELAEAYALIGDPAVWWWELRPHPLHGTLELRVPDTQITLADSAAVAAVTHALVAHLAEREPEPPVATWRIEENRWSACRHGVEGEMTDAATGDRAPTRELLHGMLDELAPAAERLGCSAELANARRLVEENGAMRQRRMAAVDGIGGVVPRLTDEFLG